MDNWNSATCLLDDIAEVWTPPGPVVVDDDVGRAGTERSVVSVELTRLVRSTVVVRVTDRRERAVEHALQTNVHRDSAGHLVDHLLSSTTRPLPVCSIQRITLCTFIRLRVATFTLALALNVHYIRNCLALSNDM